MTQTESSVGHPPVGRMLTVRQAADALQVSAETVRQWFHTGRLTGGRVGHGIRITPDSVLALVREGGAA